MRLLLASIVVGLDYQITHAEPTATEPAQILSAAQSQQLDVAVEKALQWLAQQQQRDGSFPALPNGQPVITNLAALAFLSAGHLPDSEPYATAMSVLALTTHYAMLPIHQR